jgi:methyltransferase family protein
MSIHIHHVESGDKVDDAAALEQFQHQWDTYQKLVDHDSLAHKEVGAILHDSLMAIPEPFDFLDIACGDAGQMRTALAGTKIRRYHGIDLSKPALELAAKNLEGAPFEVDLDHGDFVAALTGRQDPCDISWCSLSIHHLNTDGKRSLLQALRDSTRKFLMIYEPTMLEGEDRAAYLERFARVNKPAWSYLTPEEWDQVYQHVSTCDLPETATAWTSLGREAGFAEARQVYLDRTGFYGLYRYDR